MIGEIIQRAIDKKIYRIITHDPAGYDKGFTLVFDDGTRLRFDPYDLIDNTRHTNRIDIREANND